MAITKEKSMVLQRRIRNVVDSVLINISPLTILPTMLLPERCYQNCQTALGPFEH